MEEKNRGISRRHFLTGSAVGIASLSRGFGSTISLGAARGSKKLVSSSSAMMRVSLWLAGGLVLPPGVF